MRDRSAKQAEDAFIHIILSEISDPLIAEVASANGDVNAVILVPFKYLGFAQSHLDIAQDYLELSWAAETLSQCAADVDYEFIDCKTPPYQFALRFTVRAERGAELAAALRLIAPLWLADDSEADDDSELREGRETAHEHLWVHADGFGRVPMRFPELGETYLGNRLIGRYDLDEEGIEEENRDNPELRHEFWLSCLTPSVGSPLYCSEDCYLLSPDVDVRKLLKGIRVIDSGTAELRWSDAYAVTVNREEGLLVTATRVFKMPAEALARARNCAREVWGQEPTPSAEWTVTSLPDGSAIKISDGLGQYLFFGSELIELDEQQLGGTLRAMNIVLDPLRRRLGLLGQVACPWERLTDEGFEELCYDVLRHCGRYELGSVQKMGLSRSRDGGRDLIAYPVGRLLGGRRLWIAQCKLVRSRRSLAGRSVQVADTVDQYGAGGYIVMTNAVVDATLHDKLSGLQRNRDIGTEVWSRLELERFLLAFPELKDRHFRPAESSTPNAQRRKEKTQTSTKRAGGKTKR